MRTCLVLAAAAALAPVARANVVGGDMQNFNAVPGGIDYVTVQSSETLEPGYFNVGLMLNHAVNSLPYFDDDSQGRLKIADTLTMADIGVGMGLWENLEIGASAQDLLKQTVSGDESHGEFKSRGIINYRFYGKWHFFQSQQLGLALVGGSVFNRVKNNPYVGEGGSPVGTVELAGDTKLKKIALAVNLGYRFRKKGDPVPGTLQPVGNQYIGSVGVSYLLPFADTKLIAEVFGARPAERDATGLVARQASSLEGLLGVKYDATTNLAFHAGGGTELINGASSPDWRIYAGVNWAFGPAYKPAEVRELLKKTTAPKEERAILRNINFATGSDQVPAEALPQLQLLAKEIKRAPFTKIVVEGHTDSVGSEESNQKLSERRAQTVRQWLITNAGVPAAKITAVGYGETRPVADNGNFQGRQANRRVEVAVTR